MTLVKSVDIHVTTKKDKHLPTYDHTALSAVNTCPTWGILRYIKHKRMPNMSRAMALEAGAAAHEIFAAVRLYQLYYTQDEKELATKEAYRIFGESRAKSIFDVVSDTATTRTNLINFGLEALYTCGFEDEINDRNRTVTNISEAAIIYMDRWDLERYPIWISPNGYSGIEVPIDLTVTIELNDGGTLLFRYTGKADGIHHNKDKVIIQENKTGARIDDAWLAQWQLSHQITGYCIGVSTITNSECNDALVLGMRIPSGRDIAGAVRIESVRRGENFYENWIEWLAHTVLLIEEFNDPIHLPMYTHSCNRYFRPCTNVPFCYADNEEREQIYSEMEIDKWSPLNDKVLG